MSDKNKLSNDDMNKISGGMDSSSEPDSSKTDASKMQEISKLDFSKFNIALTYGGPNMFSRGLNANKIRQKMLNESEENKISGGKIEVSDSRIKHMVCKHGGPDPSTWGPPPASEYGGPSLHPQRQLDKNNDSTDDPLKK